MYKKCRNKLEVSLYKKYNLILISFIVKDVVELNLPKVIKFMQE